VILRRKLSNAEFKVMHSIMKLIDIVYPYVPARAKSFGIQPGMTVVDYGCGPGRYTVEFARLVKPEGRVIAVDLIQIALLETEKRLKKNGVGTVELKLAKGYDSGILSESADMICAVDMFHHVDPAQFLKETSRIAKPNGVLMISGGHQTRESIKKAVRDSGLWEIIEETRIYIKYSKLY